MSPVNAVITDPDFMSKYTHLCKVRFQNPFFHDACQEFKVVTSVCTGAAILAQTKLLHGLTATTNKQAFDDVKELVNK